MSKRSSKLGTTIEYDLHQWDSDLDPPKIRGRSNSVTRLDELLKSRRVHSKSSVAFARFPDHYYNNEHVVTHVNQAPGPTFTRSFRYGKEAKKRECHDWKRKPTSEAVSRGVQCHLQVNQRSTVVQCTPPSRDMNVQTHRMVTDSVVVRPKTRDRGLQCMLKVESDNSDLFAMIKGLKQGPCPGANIPEGLLQDVGSSLGDLLTLLKNVHRQAEVIDGKEDNILVEVQKLENIDVEKIESLLEEILGLLQQMATKAGQDDLRALFVTRLDEVMKGLTSLDEEHLHIMNAIRNIKPGSSGGDDYFKRIMSFLEDIYEYIHEEVVSEVVEVAHVTQRALYDGPCRCQDITTSTMSKGAVLRQVLPNLCQRCSNDQKGGTFVQSLSLPLAQNINIVNILGKMLECVERDDDFNLSMLIRDIRQRSPDKWRGRDYQRSFEALFHLALLGHNKKCSFALASFIDVTMMLKTIGDEEHCFTLTDYIRDAVKSQHFEVVKKLIETLDDPTKRAVINIPLVEKGKNILPVFEAVRQGDLASFRYLVSNGANLDSLEDNRSIIHEVIWTSYTKRELAKFPEWNRAMVSMLSVIYEEAGFWWERQMLHAAWTGSTESSHVNALRYLFSMEDRSRLNPLQYAARYGTPDIIKKIVRNVPYQFTPNPLEFGHDNGFKGFIVDQIESRFARKNHSVLERMLRRDALDGARVMAIEPFRSMIKDKWKRYRVFYGIWFIVYLCYMVIFTACAVNRKTNATALSEMYTTRNDFTRMAGEVFVISCLPLFFYGEIRDLFRMGWVTPRPWRRTGLFRISTCCFVMATIATVVLRLLANQGEDIALGIALLLGWLNAVEFLGAWKVCGMFAIITHHVFVGDVILRFFMVWVLTMAGTSAATFVAYQASPHQLLPSFPNGTFWTTPYSLGKVAYALLDGDYATQARDTSFGVILFMIFIFLMNVLLLNLLVAMMVDTYSRTRQKIDASWMWHVANYALLMDRRLPNFFCINYDDNDGRGFAALAPTVLRYLTRLDRRRDHDGNAVDVKEHVVLIQADDSPNLGPGRSADLVTTTPASTPREFLNNHHASS